MLWMMDDVNSIDSTLTCIDNLNPPYLKFTVEREKDEKIAFLDMEIQRNVNRLYSKWYTKSTDTSLVHNFFYKQPGC